ncbi:Methyl-viologen-reducing hydrogenase subunit G [Candidatus Zixiibacteriota bacterium]|nr:Methyl-viologen-reducing hydrogenase subunit G [candidate division Zixibacteria bacterium]
MAKPKLAVYWAASCGGCDIAILDIEEKILDVAGFFDPVFWPCAMDTKYDDIRNMPDKSITLTLFNGAIRNDENYEIAKLLRQKSVVLCAFGSCASEGCIPGLANLYDKTSIIDYVYKKSPSLDNPEGTIPSIAHKVPEGVITIPEMWNTVRTLGQTVDVDYIIPGCPPQSNQIAAVVAAVINILSNGKPLPPKGTVLGASDKSCCDECQRERNVKKIKKFVRPYEIRTDPNLCLLEQGIVCMGPATRAGCGAKCVNAGVPCRGCYGLPINIRDQGAKMASAIASVIDSTDPDEIEKIIATIPDPVGTFYRFSLPDSMLRRVQR